MSLRFETKDWSINEIIDKIKKGRIILQNEIQREFCYNDEKQSYLIESILLSIPLPTIYFFHNKDEKYEVIDGQQRLTTCLNFKDNKFAIRKKDENRESVLNIKDINDCTYSTISQKLQDNFDEFQFRCVVIQGTGTKEEDLSEAKYEIFKRLNTGAVSLNPQEIRNCIFHGICIDEVNKFSRNDNLFLRIIKYHSNDSKKWNRFKREECVLRVISFLNYEGKRKNSLQRELNDFCKEFQNHENIFKMLKNLHDLIDTSIQIFGDDIFFKQKKFSISIFETLLLLLKQHSLYSRIFLTHNEDFKKDLIKIINSEEFTKTVESSVNSQANTDKRIKLFNKLFTLYKEKNIPSNINEEEK